ncbi:hypothetical protein [Pseudooceanicola sp.]|uniref:hypothetical protein n=1 Tax=Pseudooceanicola sp. TaxID=1914328 RepID=UPI0035183335
MTASIALFQKVSESDDRTFICFGVPRGGTTMVAGLMAFCGIWMGESLPTNGEDPAFNTDRFADRETFLGQVRQAIRDRDARHSVWGWKFPRAASYLEEVLPHVRNPHLVIVTRDTTPASIRMSKRQGQTATDEGILKATTTLVSLQAKNLSLAQKFQCPTLLVSYEKAVEDPRTASKEIAAFSGLNPPSDMASVVAFAQRGKYQSYFPEHADPDRLRSP